MEKFVGIQLVEAEPMTALEASKLGYYKGNPASDGELNEMQGYHVHYFVNDSHSWRPKQTFERLFKNIPSNVISFSVNVENNNINFLL